MNKYLEKIAGPMSNALKDMGSIAKARPGLEGEIAYETASNLRKAPFGIKKDYLKMFKNSKK